MMKYNKIIYSIIHDKKLKIKIAIGVFLVFIGIMSVSLRMSAVNFHQLQMDEYYHFATAESILSGHAGNLEINARSQPYIRGWTTSLLTTLGAALGGEFDPWAVLPIVIVNTLIGVALFYYLRKTSVLAAIIATIIWTFSPLALALGSYVREYSLFILFNVVWTYFFIRTIKPNVIAINYKVIPRQAIVLFLLPVFYFLTDFKSTFANIAAIYFGIAATIIIYYIPKLPKLVRFIAATVVITLPYSVMGFLLGIINEGNINVKPAAYFQFIEYFVAGSHTFANGIFEGFTFPIVLIFAVLVMSGVLVALTSERFEIRAIVFISLSYFIFYACYFNRYFEERYYMYFIVWTILLMALGMQLYIQKAVRSLQQFSPRIQDEFVWFLALSCIVFLFGNYYILANNADIQANAVTQKLFHTQKIKNYTFLDQVHFDIDENTYIITPIEHVVLWHFSRSDEYGEYFKITDNNLHYFFNGLWRLDDRTLQMVREVEHGYFIMDNHWVIPDVDRPAYIADKPICTIYDDGLFFVMEWGGDCK